MIVKNHVGQKGVRKVMSDYIHIYCGNGKGKTTAAIGFVNSKCWSWDSSCIYSILKDGTSSEISILESIPKCIGILCQRTFWVFLGL